MYVYDCKKQKARLQFSFTNSSLFIYKFRFFIYWLIKIFVLHIGQLRFLLYWLVGIWSAIMCFTPNGKREKFSM